MAVNDLVIDVTHLHKHFAQIHAVNDLSLSVKKGEIFGFLGPNGSGKTTTIRMLCGLLTPDSGDGHCLGYDIIKQTTEIKSRTGYMTQRFSYYDEMTVLENITFIARIYQIENMSQRINEALEKFQLTKIKDQLVGHLSGGWKQRLALACCLIHNPQLLLLDEPTVGIDPVGRREFWDFIYELSQQGVTSLVSTHYMDEAERCTRLAYLSKGHLLIQGTLTDIIETINLTTWVVKGDDLVELTEQLKQQATIEQIVLFGNTLHLSDKDEEKLQSVLKLYMANEKYTFNKIDTNIEDVFIHLVGEKRE